MFSTCHSSEELLYTHPHMHIKEHRRLNILWTHPLLSCSIKHTHTNLNTYTTTQKQVFVLDSVLLTNKQISPTHKHFRHARTCTYTHTQTTPHTHTHTHTEPDTFPQGLFPILFDPAMTLALGCLEGGLLPGPRPAGWGSGREGSSRERLSPPPLTAVLSLGCQNTPEH